MGVKKKEDILYVGSETDLLRLSVDLKKKITVVSGRFKKKKRKKKKNWCFVCMFKKIDCWDREWVWN